MQRPGLTVAAIGMGLAGQLLVAAPSLAAQASQGRVTIVQTRDPETHRPGILATYWWDSRFGLRYDAVVRLYQDRRLVGQIPFMRGWTRAPAFFRTTSTSHRHTFQAVGLLLRKNGTVVNSSTVRSTRVQWRRAVQPGQVVRRAAHA